MLEEKKKHAAKPKCILLTYLLTGC